MKVAVEASKVLNFWFNEISENKWFSGDLKLDELIKDRFSDIFAKAQRCELADWRSTIEGRLAEIIVLDQFSRNLFRNSAQAFMQDAQALTLAQEALQWAHLLSVQQRAFLYMPFMHSESLTIHSQAVELFSEKGMENSLKFELLHKEIIEKFGRYPHRNTALGRKCTVEEADFIKNKSSELGFMGNSAHSK